MASQIHDDELSMSFTNVSQTRSRPSLPMVSPPSRPPVASTPPAESPAQARAAQRLNQYQLVRNIGEGSFGKVKLARHRHTGQEVAMKIINRRKLISRDLAGRIEREIQYLQLLRHPHIIKLYSVITTKTEIVMVLEYVPMELFDYIVKHGRLAENKARKLFQQIISAVEYCHRHKIVHRDLKPENLLLDKNMNVKIADFGLSNIMTDGNFLRTSCGSPNYAAPEVIGGKLYAGPEVDVWSCGVILYVFLVGRLPFDDEFIPALFRKIQAGTFHIPSQTPPGAADLIKRCLMVHPVQRIQIPEIRRHEWFMKDLPAYLKEPAEEFLDTGVDSSKAIDPQQLAPGKTPQVVAEIHEKVVDKLGRAMGYPKPDIQDALSKDEPSAIKDAYLIVHENELMVETSQYNGTGAELESFLATSPPVEPNYPNFPGSPRVTHGRGTDDIKPLTPTNSMDPRRVSRTMSDTSSLAMREEERPRISTVKVLNTSLPNVHEDVMRARDKLRSESRDPDEMFRLPSLDKATQPKSTTVPIPEEVRDPSGALIELPEEKRAEIARALKPHSRSSTNLAALQATTREPEKLPAVPEQAPEKKSAPKAKTRRWQFGIRSRNQPYEAMKCLYQALKQCGAEWEVLPAVKTSHHDQEPNGNDDEEGDEDPELDRNPLELEPGQRHTILQSKYDFLPSDYYVPRDNWNIRARILKKGALPGEVGLVSGHSSAVSLSGDATQQLKRHIEELSGHVPEEVMRSLAANGPTGNMAQKLKSTSQQASRPSSSIGDHPNNAHISAVKDSHSRPESSYSLDTSKMTAKNVGIWVFIDIQLYTLDTQTYVVDFKCDGYQSVLWCEPKHKSGTTPNSNAASAVTSPAASRPQSSVMEESHLRRNLSYEVKKAEGYWKPISKRFKNVEKEASSPYPYLDVASDLVAQLASG